MRVTFVTTKINFERAGGSVPDLDLKVRDMQALGATVRVVTVYSQHNLLPSSLPYPVSEEQTPIKTLPAIQKNIVRVLKKYEADTDVFHIEGHFAYAGGWYRMRGGKPVVIFYNREMLVWERAGLRRALRRIVEQVLYRTIVPFIDYFIFTTPLFYAQYRDFGLRVPERKATVMLDFFDADAIRKHASAKKASARLQVFSSGRMIPEKGFRLLIEAIARLPEETHQKADIVLCGDGPELVPLKELAHEHHLNIHFPGWVSREDFWKYLANADIFILPRWQFELPSVIVMEALSLAIPTIAPGGGGVEWMAQDAMQPFHNEDADSLAQALGTLIEHKSERDRLMQAAQVRAPKIDHLASRDRLFSILSSVAQEK